MDVVKTDCDISLLRKAVSTALPIPRVVPAIALFIQATLTEYWFLGIRLVSVALRLKIL
jgi:hypothetical protein